MPLYLDMLEKKNKTTGNLKFRYISIYYKSSRDV